MKSKKPKAIRSRVRPGAVTGRPSKFSPDLSQKMRDFCADSALNTLEDFAKLHGVARNSLTNWARKQNPDGSLKHPEFAQAFAAAMGQPKAKP